MLKPDKKEDVSSYIDPEVWIKQPLVLVVKGF